MEKKPEFHKHSINKEKIKDLPGAHALLRMADYMDNWVLKYNNDKYLEIPSYEDMVTADVNKEWESKSIKKYGEVFNSLTAAQKEKLYYDQLFVDKFGLEAYNNMPYYSERRSYFEYKLDQENNDLIKKIYKDDPRLDDFLNLLPEYKERLFTEKIMPFTKEQAEEMDEVIYQIEALNKLLYQNPQPEAEDAHNFMWAAFGDYMNQRTEPSEYYSGEIPIIGRGKGSRDIKTYYTKELKHTIHGTNSRGHLMYDEEYVGTRTYIIGFSEAEENYLKGKDIINSQRADLFTEQWYARMEEERKRLRALTKEDKIKIGEEILKASGSKYLAVYGEDKLKSLGLINDDTKLFYGEEYVRQDGNFESVVRMAGRVLDVEAQDAIAEDEGFFETLKKGGKHFVNGLAADFSLMVGSAYTYLVEGEDAFTDYITTGHGAYLQDVAATGSWKSSDISNYNKYGIAKSMPVWSYNQEHGWLNAKTFYDAAQQSKWFVELAAMEYLTGGIGGMASKGLNATTRAAKVATTAGRSYNASKNIIRAIDYAAKPLQIAGTVARQASVAYPISLQEGVSAARETFNYISLDFEERANEYANTMVNSWVESNRNTINQEALKRLNDYAKTNNINPEDLDIDYYISEVIDDYKRAMFDVYYNSYKTNNIDRFNEAKYSSVEAAFKTTFVLSTVKTAVTNEAFRNWVFKSYPSYKFGNKELSSRMKLNPENGKLEHVPMTKFQKYVKPFIHNPITEGADELSDVLISSFGTGLGNEVYNRHYEGTDDNNFNTYMSYISSGLVSSKNALYEESTWREAYAGAFSGLVGVTPNIRGIVGMFGDKNKDGTKRTKLEKIGNIVINPVLNDILSNKTQEAEAQRVIDIYNKALDKHQNTYNSMSSVSKAMAELETAYMLRNPSLIDNAKQEAVFHMMVLLEEMESNDIIKDSQIVKNSLDMLERISSGEISDEEIQEYINSLEESERKNVGVEQAKEYIQNKASELLKSRDEIKNIKKHFNSIPSFRNLSKDLQNNIIHNEYNIKRWKQEIENTSTELHISSRDSNSPIVASKKDLDEQIKKYKDSIKALEKQLDKSKEELFDTDNKENYNKLLIKELESSIAILKSNMLKLQNKYSTLKDGDYAATITAEEMATLDAASLSYLLDEDNKNKFSNEQLNEIERFKQEKNLNKENISSIHKIKNLQQSIKISEKIQKTILSNPKTLSDYLKANCTKFAQYPGCNCQSLKANPIAYKNNLTL
jgi:hypothetical protein